MDRLKASWDMGNDTNLYSYGYIGNTENQLTETNRQYSGADLRLTNNSIENLTVTTYAKLKSDHAENQTNPLNTLYPSMASFYQESSIADLAPQIGRDTWATGVNGRWTPFRDEGCDIAAQRDGLYRRLRVWPDPQDRCDYDTIATTPTTLFYQPDTDTNTFTVGVEEKWNLHFTSYLRYKYITTQYPLFGITPDEEARRWTPP